MMICYTFDPDLKFLRQRVWAWHTIRVGRTRREELAYKCGASESKGVEKGENHVRK